MNNITLVKEELEHICETCKGSGKAPIKTNSKFTILDYCKACDGLGVYRKNIYYGLKNLEIFKRNL